MTERMQRILNFNKRNNDLPRRLVLIAATFLALYVFIRLFKYVAPFVIGFAVASLIEPLLKRLLRASRWMHMGRGVLAVLLSLLTYGLLIALISSLVLIVIAETQAFIPRFIDWLGELANTLSGLTGSVDLPDELPIPDALIEDIGQSLTSSISLLSTTITDFAMDRAIWLATFAFDTAMAVPETILFLMLMIMSTVYFLADRQRIFASVSKFLPDSMRAAGGAMKESMARALLGHLRSMLIMFIITFAELSIGFIVLGFDSALLLALIIAILDAMPVVGAGLFLIPIALYGMIFGQFWMGVGTLILYLITIAVRQMVEPRVLGRQLGLHPLLTMMSMFAGLVAMGFAGMLLGPVLALVCVAVLSQPAFSMNDGETPPKAEKAKPVTLTKKLLARKQHKNEHTDEQVDQHADVHTDEHADEHTNEHADEHPDERGKGADA